MRVYTLGRDSTVDVVAEKHLATQEADPHELHPGANFTKGLFFGTLLSLPFWIGVIWLIAR